MIVKDGNEWRAADRGIMGVIRNLCMDESPGARAQSEPSTLKSRQMWTFIVGFAAGIIAFALFFGK